MKRLALSTILLSGLLSGCIIEVDDLEPTGAINVAWILSEPGCPAGTPAIEVITVNNSTMMKTTDIFDCSAAGTGIVEFVPIGEYTVYIEVKTADLGTLLAQSNSIQAIVEENLDTPVALPAFPALSGFFSWGWDIQDSGGAPLTCDQVGPAGASGVRIISTLATTTTALADIVDCDLGEGVTSEIPIGTYTIALDIIDGNDLSLGTAPVFEESITFGNELKDLGAFTFIPTP